MGKAGGIVLAILIAVGFTIYNRSSDSSEVRDQGVTIVELLNGYDQQDEYYMELFEKAHDIAFGAAYSGGGRRHAAEFDAEKYKNKLIDHMALLARADGESAIADKIQQSKYEITFEEIPG